MGLIPTIVFGLWLLGCSVNVTQVNGAVLGKTGVIPEKKGRFFLGDHDVTFGITGSKLSLIGGLHGTGFPYSSPFLGPHYGGGGSIFGSLGGFHGGFQGGFHGGLVLKNYKHHHFYGPYFGGVGGGYYPPLQIPPFGYFG